jgi:AntA/AntB antirepressor
MKKYHQEKFPNENTQIQGVNSILCSILLLVRESKSVRKATIQYLDNLENQLKSSQTIISNQNDHYQDIVKSKTKDFKTNLKTIKSDIGVEINILIRKLFLGDNMTMRHAHIKSMDKYKSETGLVYVVAKAVKCYYHRMNYSNKPVVYARQIWTELGLKSEFVNWCKLNIKRLSLVAPTDYIRVRKKVKRVVGITTRYEYYFTPEVMVRILNLTNGPDQSIVNQIIDRINKDLLS